MKIKILAVLLFASILSSCTAPLGTVSMHGVSSNKLNSPLVKTTELDNLSMIYKTNEDTKASGDDVFAIYLTDSYLRYLQDFGGVNEVLFVVEFTEVVTGTEQDTITKILGPYNNLADASKAPLLNKLLYGPKRMESDVLSMNLKVYEYDLEENENTAAMLDFIAGATNALSLANPVTQGEIEVAKEIAKTLTTTNENDLVLELDVDFVAGHKTYKPYATSRVLPLRDGEFFVVKQEACRVGTCYNYFSHHGENSVNLPGYITDAVMFIPTAIMRATTDLPDKDALTDFVPDSVTVDDRGLAMANEFYTNKTWVRLNVVKGGDPTQWDVRKMLYPAEAEINRLLKNPNALGTENFKANLKKIDEAKNLLEKSRTQSIELQSSYAQNQIQFIKVGDSASDICIKHNQDISLTSGTERIVGNITAQSPTISTAANSKGMVCFKVSVTGSFAATDGEFQVNYTENGKSLSFIRPVKVIAPLASIAAANLSCQKQSSNSQLVDVKVTLSNNKSISKVFVDRQQTSFSTDASGIALETMLKDLTIEITDVFGITQPVQMLAANCK